MADKATTHWPLTLTNGAAALLNIALPLTLVRILPPEQVGCYSVFFLYLMICPGLFLVTGLNNGLYHWAGKYPETKSEVQTSWTLLVVMTGVFSLIGLIFSRWLAPWIKLSASDMRLLFLCIPFSTASFFLEDLMVARGDIWTGSFYGSGFNALRVAGILAAAWWTRSLAWVFGIFFACTVIRTLIGYRLLDKTGDVQWLFDWEPIKPVLKYAIPISLAAVGTLALQNVDQMILSTRLAPAKFAFYAMGCLSIPPLQIFESSVNRVLIPRLSQAFSAKDHPRAAALFSEAVSELFLFLLPATVGLILYSRPIVQVLFTQRYLPAADFLRFYALVYLFWSLPFDSVARARGDANWIMRSTLSFSLFCIAATWLATGRWSAMGALIAVLISQFLMRLYSLTYDRRCFAAPLAKFLPLRGMLRQGGMALAAAACSLLMRPLFSDPRVWFFVTGPIFTVLYFGGLWGIRSRRTIDGAGPIHVLELSQTLCLGGLERTVYSLAQTLNQNERFKVLVASYDHPENQPSLAPQIREAGIPLIQWQKGRGFSPRTVLRLVRLISSERLQILHVHDLGPLIYGSLAKVFSGGRVRLILTLHTMLDIETNPRYRFYYKIFLRIPDQIIAVSPAIQAGLTALGVPPERVDVIPNGVSFLFSPRRVSELTKVILRKRLLPHLTPDLYAARWLLCLARLHPGKGQEVVLDVWNALPHEARAKLALFFVGQETQAGYRNVLQQRILRALNRERILIVGPSERPQDWIQSADLFISGSLHEGMPLAPLEAAGSGLPTLLSDIEGHRFLKPWAHSFDPKHPKEGAGCILEILSAMNQDAENKLFETRWQAASALRHQWGAPAMTASYAEVFLG